MANTLDEPPPEGPEVRKVYEGLIKEIGNSNIVKANILGGRFIKNGMKGYDSLRFPFCILSGGVKGKLIYFILSGGQYMKCRLGMTAKWSLENEIHSGFELVLDNGKSLFFIDQRHFGSIEFGNDVSILEKDLRKLGIDILNDTSSSSDDLFFALNQKPERTICEALMDQHVCAGVGNYIKCEALYMSKISPKRKVISLTNQEIDLLFNSLKQIMTESYNQVGASIRNYEQVDGSIGTYIDNFQVYGKKIDPFGNKVIKELTPDKRTTHWVPNVQF